MPARPRLHHAPTPPGPSPAALSNPGPTGPCPSETGPGRSFDASPCRRGRYMRGAFLTIDRPYPPLIDWLHHRIGTTHVAHHIDCTIPHYHAREATDAIAKAFPKAYLFEPTPVHRALWRVCCNCIAVRRRSPTDGRLVFVPYESWTSE